MSIFPKEVCYHLDPTCVYDCVDWDGRYYILKNDHGDTVRALTDEFTLLSSCEEPLIIADGKGGFIVDERLSSPRPSLASKAHTKVNIPRKVRAAKGSEARPTGEPLASPSILKEQVRELLSHCESREDIASVAAGILDVNPAGLLEKYANQDNGRFRMIIGNRLRGALKAMLLKKGAQGGAV